MQKLAFHKYEATGNDFILLEQEIDPLLIASLCHRRYAIGADGLIILLGRRMLYYNADGSRAALCLNGLRAVMTHLGGGIVETDAGPFEGKDQGVYIPPPVLKSRDVFLEELGVFGHFYCAGVPHFITEHPFDFKLARAIRFHPFFGKEGTNVNFYKRVKKDFWLCKTYERGVEDLTLSCGTGASACFAHMEEEKGVIAFAQENSLSFVKEGSRILMEGRARLVFSGTIPALSAIFLGRDYLSEEILNADCYS